MSNKNTVVKIGDNFKNRSIGHDAMVEIVEDLKSIKQIIYEALNLHTASHGDTYHFKDEIDPNEARISEYMRQMPKMGVTRKPNPYEKKKFAGDAVNKLHEANDKLSKVIWQEIGDFHDE